MGEVEGLDDLAEAAREDVRHGESDRVAREEVEETDAFLFVPQEVGPAGSPGEEVHGSKEDDQDEEKNVDAVNIVPGEDVAFFDCRILPGQNPTQAMNEIKDLIRDVGLEKLDFETIQANEPSESSAKTPLYELIVNALKEFEPDCSAAPILLTGGTDSRFFRKIGSICYGFQPQRADMPYGEMLKTIHGIDERISIANLVFGTSLLYSIVESFMT